MADELTIKAEKEVNKVSETEEEITLILRFKGRINTNTAPEFEEAVENNLKGSDKVILDFTQLDYMSSAGIRVVLKIYKKTGSDSSCLTICNPNPGIMEVLNITGMTEKVTIDKTATEA
jgi:anti-anti-sigma factor